MALRLEEVQPPKTAATQSELISFSAFSAKVFGSDAPSSSTTSSFLPMTPPDALIWSTANLVAFATVTSLMAMVPVSECSEPILMVSFEVSTQDLALEPDAVLSSREPQPETSATDSTRAVGMVIALTRRAVRCRRWESCMGRTLLTSRGSASAGYQHSDATCAACEYRRVYNGCIRGANGKREVLRRNDSR